MGCFNQAQAMGIIAVAQGAHLRDFTEIGICVLLPLSADYPTIKLSQVYVTLWKDQPACESPQAKKSLPGEIPLIFATSSTLLYQILKKN